MSIRLTVIIPVYGNWEDTGECLRCLAFQTSQDFTVLLADDGSPVPPPDDVLAFPFVRYFRRDNAGFAGNCNRAAREAIASGATHLLLLNNDTTFGREFIAGWLDVIRAQPRAIVSPLVYWHSNRERLWWSGGPMSLLVPFIAQRRVYSKPTVVDVLCGCTLLVPVAAWQALEGLDERYTFYFEDVDFALRARRTGFSCYIFPDPAIRVWHKVSGSFRGGSAWKQHYPLLRSQIFFIRSHYRGAAKYLCLLLGVCHTSWFWLRHLPQWPDARLLAGAVAAGFREPPSVRGEAA